MTRFSEMFSSYQAIHRSPINRASHAFGIPLIMTSVIAALSYLHLPGAGLWWLANAATLLTIFTAGVVLSWSRLAGAAYLVLVGVCYAVAQWLHMHLDGFTSAATIAGMFAFGWTFQLIGHAFEGKSPEFVKRPENLLLGPVMVMAELVPVIRPCQARNVVPQAASTTAENRVFASRR